MTRCTGGRGTGFARTPAGVQEPLDAARSACAVASAQAGWSLAPAAPPGCFLAPGTPAALSPSVGLSRSGGRKTRDTRIATEETLGPVATVTAFSSEDEAVESATDRTTDCRPGVQRRHSGGRVGC
ncbi:hypothetical protein GCM10019016_017440 [Streptomyces prasinosporus]|uniref:Uncharacterized protein n=1 Tax=Streptomyces prasinosporus TaxID=68256 RepID=A0ABP6TJ72_9ACTN